jgi:hypothetical protein
MFMTDRALAPLGSAHGPAYGVVHDHPRGGSGALLPLLCGAHLKNILHHAARLAAALSGDTRNGIVRNDRTP